MTTAHRPTFDPARGKDVQRGPAYHQRMLPAHTHLKQRQAGQGGSGDAGVRRDLRAELLKAEAAVKARREGKTTFSDETNEDENEKVKEIAAAGEKRKQIAGDTLDGEAESAEEDPETKRRRLILEQAAEEDRSSSEEGDDDDEDDDDSEDDSEDEQEALQRELAKIKMERAAQKQKEDEERAQKEAEEKEVHIARSNPLLDPKRDFEQKRRWDDDVVFKNQARGIRDKEKKQQFTNDLLRSDFHKKFMSKYVR